VRLLTAAFFSLLTLSSAYGITEQEALKLLKERALNVRGAEIGVREAGLSLKATKRLFFPKVSLTASFQEIYPDFFGNWNQNYTVGGSVSAQPLNFQNFVQLKIGKLQVERAEEGVRRELLTAAYQLLKELYTLKALEERIRLKEESLKAAREIYKVAKEKYQKGLVMITDVLKARAQVSQTEAEVESLKAHYAQTFNRLNELLDFALQAGERAEVELKEELPELEEKELLEKAMELRPEVKEAEKRVKEAALRVELQKSALRPTLTLSANAQRTGSKFWPESSSYSAGFTLNFPIFDSGLTKFRALTEEKRKERSSLELRQVKNQVKREVLDAIVGVNSSYRTYLSEKDFLEFSRKAYERALNEYKLGVSDIVALMQAFTNLKSAQDALVNSLLNYNLSLIELKKATGELLLEVEK
jgi:outer membrane protein TolC